MLLVGGGLDAQTRKTSPTKKPAKTTKKAAAPIITRIQAEWQCPSELGVGVTTTRKFCDVLTGREPKDGVLITIPPHRGPLMLSFELHNRHTYSEELVKAKQAFRKYTATIGVLSMDNTLVDRAVVQSEFRTAKDLFDRIGGGAGGTMKAVAPAGREQVFATIPAGVDQVTLLGETLDAITPAGHETVVMPGRPVAIVSNVLFEYRPAPPKR